jgi:hypothetical protein
MKTKLKTFLLVLFLACSLGVVQAQTEGNNTYQLGNVSEGLGDVRWVSVNENETVFDLTQEPILISGNFTSINGTFFLNLTDLSTTAISPSNETSRAEFNFTDPGGQIKYAVILRNIDNVVESLFTFNCFNGNFSSDICEGPITYTYGTIRGVGEFFVNDTLVSKNRIIRVMAIERVNSSDNEGYKSIFDKELPRKGMEIRLFLPDLVVNESGTIEKQPVPTNYTLPDGQDQSFISIFFENCQFEGQKIFFNNTSGDISGNMTEGMENTN